MYALRASRLRTDFRCFPLELGVLVHILRIVPSGNDAPKAVPDKSLGSDIVIKMVVDVNLWTWLSRFAWHRHSFEEVHKAWP